MSGRVSNVSLVPVPFQSTDPTCANCGAALLGDQRYCLSCGQPVSPIRLAFLDVLQSEGNRPGSPAGWMAANTLELGPAGYGPGVHQPGLNGWLRRYSGLLALLGVLAMCLLVGLLVGHWVTQGKAPPKQVVEIRGLPTAPAAASASPTSTTPGATPGVSTTGSSNPKAEAAEAREAAKETPAEKAPPPPAVKVQPQTIKKLTNSKGAQHQQEINKLIEGGKPIETG
jgi:hypothetical protein